MFIKKDLRKIPRILADASLVEDEDAMADDEQIPKRVKREQLTDLKLARRKAEFRGNMKILCQPSTAPALRNLKSLSVYDCDIKSIEGIGLLGSVVQGETICCPSLEILNLGRNPLTELPQELSMLSKSLKELWCDDCNIQGPLPECILHLDQLESLNMANNAVTEIPESISNLQNLTRLCLDSNKIQEIPTELAQLVKLQELMLRKNNISHLPCLEKMTHLRLLHVSSNQLTTLRIQNCQSLQVLYANCNKLEYVPVGLVQLSNLRRANLSNNFITDLSTDFQDRFGTPHVLTGMASSSSNDDDDACVIYVGQNPVHVESSNAPTSATAADTHREIAVA